MRILLSFVLAAATAMAQQYAIATIAGGPAIPTPISAASASIGEPTAVAITPAGDLYFANGSPGLYKIDARGVLTRVPTPTPLGVLTGLAADTAGNVYASDSTYQRVVKLSASGNVTIASGSAQLSRPMGVAVDSAGTLYVADAGSGQVLRISTSGNSSALAQITSPAGVAVDASGNVYVADTSSHRIQKVALGGTVTTIAGHGTAGFSGDNGPALAAQLNSPSGVAVDYTGTLYISDSGNHRLRRVLPGGTITSLAGNGNPGFSSDSGPASTAMLNRPSGIAVDLIGNLYLADQFNYRLRKIGTNGGIAPIAGNGARSFSVNGGAASGAQLDQPKALAMDAAGNLYIADGNNCRVRKVSPNGTITTIAGTGAPGYSGDNGPATGAQLAYQLGIAVSPAGELYIADSFNHRVRKVALNGIITTVAGTGSPGYSGDGGPATSAQVNNINGVALDFDGTLYIADYGNYRIRKVVNGIITTVAGTGVSGYSGDRGQAASAQISTTWGMALDGTGNLYFSDYLNHRIRKVSNGIITTVAGSGAYGAAGDGGLALSAQLAYPTGLAVDPTGNFYLVDSDNYSIRKVSSSGVINTIAGNGTPGYSGDGGRGTAAQLGISWGMVLDQGGNLFFADSGNNAIRVLKPLSALLSISGLVNAASNANGAIAPGEIVVLYGAGVGPSTLTQARLDVNGMYGTSLATTRVLFNGTPAPVLYTWSSQVSVIVPYNVSGTASLQIEYQGVRSDAITVPVAQAAPALFTVDASGKGQAAAFNEDGSLNTAARPAKPGSVVVVYATGEGQTSPAGVDGQLATASYPKPVLPVSVTIDGKTTELLYAGAAPGLVAGLMQLNVRVPANAQAGNVPIAITVGTITSPSGTSIAVSAP